MMDFRRALIASSLLAGAAIASPASAQVATYNSQSSFASATTNTTTYGFDFTSQPVSGDTYTLGPVTFSSSQLTSYNDAYGMPYITDNNWGQASANTFTISSTTSALGLFLGSYDGAATYSYLVNGVAGTVDVPAPNDTTFLGFSDASGPISVTFNVLGDYGAATELDVPQFVAGDSAVGSVPEPATWAMMLLGFGGIGLAMRRQRRNAVPAQLA